MFSPVDKMEEGNILEKIHKKSNYKIKINKKV